MPRSDRPYFQLQQTREIASAFAKHGVKYLFIGKGGAIILGYPGATQDVDLFPEKTPENGRRIVRALAEIGFNLTDRATDDIIAGVDFVQLKDGPFDLDLIFAPDGIEDFESADRRKHEIDQLPVANIRDIIASKRAAGRDRDLVDLPLLEDFREEFEKMRRREPRSSIELALDKSPSDDKRT